MRLLATRSLPVRRFPEKISLYAPQAYMAMLGNRNHHFPLSQQRYYNGKSVKTTHSPVTLTPVKNDLTAYLIVAAVVAVAGFAIYKGKPFTGKVSVFDGKAEVEVPKEERPPQSQQVMAGGKSESGSVKATQNSGSHSKQKMGIFSAKDNIDLSQGQTSGNEAATPRP